jgi:DNA-binding MarR family transcriptional regulator
MRAVRVALTVKGRGLAGEFYAETYRRIEELAMGLGPAERDMLAGLLGRVVLDNKVPVLFEEPGEGGPSEH